PVQLALGYASEAVRDRVLSDTLLGAHFRLGIVVLMLVALRLAWRWRHGTPRHAPPGVAAGHWRIARGVHRLLYALLLMLPLSGYVIWIWMGADRALIGPLQVPALFTPPADDETGRAWAWYLHVYGAWVLIGLVVLHAAAALRHAWRGSGERRDASERHRDAHADR
ncbi:MAG TPA: cytochrome b/b6 domain-containing protein, partial [Dokdonella sp.]|uniref:cytochrome b n=1 Tax=Dokdonella sp. TaxID=2291710 RepID=UPI002BD58D8C